MGVRKRTIPLKKAAYRSGYEKKVAKHLEDLGVPFEFESEKIPYTQPATDKKYLPDFKLANGIYIEAKGVWDSSSRKKMVWVIEQNPDKDIRMLFQRNNYLRKGSKTTYGAWCDKRGIRWAVSSSGAVPESWINEKPRVSSETKKPSGVDKPVKKETKRRTKK
jgi:hypothetical protein